MGPNAFDKSWLCPRPEDRDRLVDMERRLRPMRLATFGPIAIGLLVFMPWAGWWPLPLMGIALGGFLLASRGLASARRPEYRVAFAWVLSVAVIAAGCVATGGLRGPATPWLAIPVVALAVRFHVRGVIAGGVFTVAIVVALAVFDGGPVTHEYPLVIPTGAVLVLLAANLGYTVTLLHSDLDHRDEAVIDPLTGMLNRHALQRRVAELTEQARISRQPIALIMADIDHFKAINDRYGHARGDAVLAEAAYRLRAQLRAYDLAYRLGGEEFLVVLPGAGRRAALDIAEALRVAIENAPVDGVTFTISLGVSTSPGECFHFDELLAAADAALYESKRTGRNRVCEAAPATGAALALAA